MIEVQFNTINVSQEEVDIQFASLEQHAGIYFGVDAGIEGLHPLQATLLSQPALAFHLYGDGIVVKCLTQWGSALVATKEITLWQTKSARGAGQTVQESLRLFLACFTTSPDFMLIGALPFDAHCLNAPTDFIDPLGIVFLGPHLLRREGTGKWRKIELNVPELPSLVQKNDLAIQPERSTAISLIQDAMASDPQDDSAPGGYAVMVSRALARLKETALVSLTLSQTYRRRVSMKSTEAFARLRKTNPAPACFFLNNGEGLHLLGASPDLQLIIQDRQVVSLPVCGTVAKRSSPVGESLSLQDLINEEVDAASLAVCSDALRNDLAPLCLPGTLHLTHRRKPMMLATVVHAVDRIQGQLLESCDAWDAIFATAAPVMVTGTPRVQALAAISEFEISSRGWYGGLVVQVSSNGDALAGTLLRAAAVEKGIAQVRTGGDLMADSSPEREEQESRLKTLSLWRAFGLEPLAQVQLVRKSVSHTPQSICLVDCQDPFGAAVLDFVLGLGIRLDPASRTQLRVGSFQGANWPTQNCIAMGDAAYLLLKNSGFDVQEISPLNGRLSVNRSRYGSPENLPLEFVTVKYTQFQILNTLQPPGWTVWTEDENGIASTWINAEKKLACLLFRADSMMSDKGAQNVFQEALTFIS
ncbi:MAG: chorismate-binding protein [Burkholderiales bacterium]